MAAATRRRIVVAMSGGVDSSVSAHLLRCAHPNAEIVGLHMSNWDASDEDPDPRSGSKSSPSSSAWDGGRSRRSGSFCVQTEREATDARAACDHLGLPMHRASFAAEYWTGVFEPFVEGVAEGKMPNPDVGCNSIVKFGAMRKYAMNTLGAESIATGHYARLWHRRRVAIGTMPELVEEAVCDSSELDWLPSWGPGRNVSITGKNLPSLLLAAADLGKDQSYFLCGVNGNAFKNVLFPLGGLKKTGKLEARETPSLSRGVREKSEGEVSCSSRGTGQDQSIDKTVREIAEKAGLPTAKKKESMGICFVGKRNFQAFISQYLPSVALPGDFVDVDTGEIVGRHQGASHFTIGQGAKISGASKKWFVAGRSDFDCGTIFVCGDTHHPSLYSQELYVKAESFNWVGGSMPPPLIEGKSMLALCRTRHLQPLMPCSVFWDQCKSQILIRFDTPVRAITPGQTSALYVGSGGLVCLGGGQISGKSPSYHDLGLVLPPNLFPAGNNDLSVKAL